eukprot:TRINITY_DN91337_c0_g1_i1.p1 TRINITY_DN91337_c0_g1~~TRINITY_DN91337_c0_g1_i1.p1  ORF type:complete len:141 (-),score=14.98 TRINITY_DN91337_c0_g1_i1:135-557(-)
MGNTHNEPEVTAASDLPNQVRMPWSVLAPPSSMSYADCGAVSATTNGDLYNPRVRQHKAYIVEDAKNTALLSLEKQAVAKGATHLFGVRFDFESVGTHSSWGVVTVIAQAIRVYPPEEAQHSPRTLMAPHHYTTQNQPWR